MGDVGEEVGEDAVVVEGDVAVEAAHRVAVDQGVRPKPSGRGRVASLGYHSGAESLVERATQGQPHLLHRSAGLLPHPLGLLALAGAAAEPR